MKKTVNLSKKQTPDQQRMAVLRLELDYELATLFDAMGEKNNEKMEKCKRQLKAIRQELLDLNAL